MRGPGAKVPSEPDRDIPESIESAAWGRRLDPRSGEKGASARVSLGAVPPTRGRGGHIARLSPGEFSPMGTRIAQWSLLFDAALQLLSRLCFPL